MEENLEKNQEGAVPGKVQAAKRQKVSVTCTPFLQT